MKRFEPPILFKSMLTGILAVFLIPIVPVSPARGAPQAESPPSDQSTEGYRGELGVTMARVREELLTLPDYDVFDWIEAEIFDDGSVVLEGSVVDPTTRDDATARIEDLENVGEITNNIEVLPLSAADDQIRLAIYETIYGADSPLYRYRGRTLPPVHIIVNRGRVTLEGTLATRVDRQFVQSEARSVPGVFDVENNIRLEPRA